MANFTWIKEKIPEGIKIKQVYAVSFNDDGNIMLMIDEGKYALIGGKPEGNEKTFEETLKREYLEEVNTIVDDIHYLGYLLVEDEEESYAQVRMIAKIKSIGERKIDPDRGRTYERMMVLPRNVKKYLNYSGEAGNKMLDDAILLAKEKYNLKDATKEYYI